jgi:hypothetical protein
MDVSFCMKSYDPPFNEERMPQPTTLWSLLQTTVQVYLISWIENTSDVQEFPQDFSP